MNLENKEIRALQELGNYCKSSPLYQTHTLTFTHKIHDSHISVQHIWTRAIHVAVDFNGLYTPFQTSDIFFFSLSFHCRFQIVNRISQCILDRYQLYLLLLFLNRYLFSTVLLWRQLFLQYLSPLCFWVPVTQADLTSRCHLPFGLSINMAAVSQAAADTYCTYDKWNRWLGKEKGGLDGLRRLDMAWRKSVSRDTSSS